jgi:hypothetical protein
MSRGDDKDEKDDDKKDDEKKCCFDAMMEYNSIGAVVEECDLFATALKALTAEQKTAAETEYKAS